MLLLILITQNNENYIDFDALNSKQMHITSEYVTYNNKKQLHGDVFACNDMNKLLFS